MKRIFISVGSEGLKGLKELLSRLCVENLFDKFDDYYIAFDSMADAVEDFNRIRDKLRTSRIQGYILKIEPRDHKVMESFQEGWAAREIPAGGVGGDRTTSGKAISTFRNVWHDTDLGLNNNLQPEDKIIIVGSAFGGTSGGMFLNVCEYLDLIIRRKRNANENFSKVQVLGFLLMPEGVAEEGNYPVALNMIDMFRELQTISWQRRLESSRPGFKVPVWSQLENDYFPLFTDTTPGANLILEYGISGSSLPMGQLYLLPTPLGKRRYVHSLLGETLLVASYLCIDAGHARWVDRIRKGGLGPETNLNVDDRCFAGFNMFCMKSGRTISLKNWFYKGIIAAVNGKQGVGGVRSLNPNSEIQDNIVAVFLQAQVPEMDVEPYAGMGNQAGSSLATLLDAEKKARSTPKSFSSFRTELSALLDSVNAEAPAFNVIPANEMITLLACSNKEYSSWNKWMNFELIKQAYNEFYAGLQTESNMVNDYKSKLINALTDSICLVDLRTKNRAVKDWYLGLAQEEEVFKEVVKAFHVIFEIRLRQYIFACRCAKTGFIPVNNFYDQVEEFKSICCKIGDSAMTEINNMVNDINPYIINGTLIDPLELPQPFNKKLDFDPLQILFACAYRTAVPSKKENQELMRHIARLSHNGAPALLNRLDMTGSQLLDYCAEEAMKGFSRIADSCVQNVNPLTHATFANFVERKHAGQCKTHAPEFNVPDAGDYHYHFVIQLGTPPANFSMNNTDVAVEPLNISTMPNTANAMTDFLSVPHRGNNDNYWRDVNNTPILGGANQPVADLGLQGLWLGTLGIDFEARDIINRIYAPVLHVTRDWIAAGNNAMVRRRTLTSVEMVSFGVVVEAIEEKVRETWRERVGRPGNAPDRVETYPNLITISFENQTQATFDLPAGSMRELGFIDDGNEKILCKLDKISVKWTGAITKWLRDQGINGFSRFFHQHNFQSIQRTEDNIFTDIKFSISNAEMVEMDKLKMAVLKTINISGM